MNTLVRSLLLLRPTDRAKLFALILGSAFIALLEMASVTLVTLFVSILSVPEKLAEIYWFQRLSDVLPDIMGSHLLISSGLLALSIVLVKSVCWIVWNHFQWRFLANLRSIYAERAVRICLLSPYLELARLGDTKLHQYVHQDIHNFFESYLFAFIQIISEFLIILCVFGIFFFAGTYAFFGPLLFFFVIFGLQQLLIGPRIKRTGDAHHHAALEGYYFTHQILQGIREIIVFGRADWFSSKYRKSMDGYAKTVREYRQLIEIPKIVFEIAAIGCTLAFCFFVYADPQNHKVLFPLLALFGLSVFRLTPSVARLQNALHRISFYSKNTESLLELDSHLSQWAATAMEDPSKTPLSLNKRISIENVSFSYPKASQPALRSVTEEIKAGEAVALVGPSGSGKSTLLNLLIGLMAPTSGQIKIDDVPLSPYDSQWFKSIGYVPQNIFIFAASVRENISLGRQFSLDDDARIWKCLEEAQMKSFVEGLEQGLDTVLQERGTNLSGGQQQRLGIARALFSEPALLILDEATSGLDRETEDKVLDTVFSLKSKLASGLTLILVTHKDELAKRCDRSIGVSK